MIDELFRLNLHSLVPPVGCPGGLANIHGFAKLISRSDIKHYKDPIIQRFRER
jgi:hypothetical protein